jgi:hypothetical protein
LVRRWLKRFNAHGLAGLMDRPRCGRKPTYPCRPDPRLPRGAHRPRDRLRAARQRVRLTFRPAAGEALTQGYTRRTTANRVAFLERVERRVPAGVARIYAVLNDLSAHCVMAVLFFSLAHPRWAFIRSASRVRRNHVWR